MGQHNLFWTWFGDNIGSIESHCLNPDPKLMQQLVQQLHLYNDLLYFEITAEPAKELIITANGDMTQFQSVVDLIDRAPALPGWKFTALKSGVGFDFHTEFNGVKYDPEQLWFYPITNKADKLKSLSLRIGVPGHVDAYPDDAYVEEAMWLILETALGEMECAQSIDHVIVDSLPSYPHKNGYIQLTTLKDYIDWFYDQ